MRPIIEAIKAHYIVEIGSDTGVNTKNILEYCKNYDAQMTAIDPSPQIDIDKFKAEYGDKFEIYTELSLSRLPLLKDYDVILVDGDHNWYTVSNELKIIEKSFKNKNKFPLIFLHDVGWPYGRRDLYYNPENIPEFYRQPYKKLGLYPCETGLKNEGGLNSNFNNSIYENNLNNGVLTAVEDFIDNSELEFSYIQVDAFFGLGILFLKSKELENIIMKIVRSDNLLKCLEEERVKLTIGYSESRHKNNLIQKKLYESHEIAKKDKHTQAQIKLSNERLRSELKISNDKLVSSQTELRSSNDLINKQKELINVLENRVKVVEGLKSEVDDLLNRFYEAEYFNGKNRSFFQRFVSRFPSLYILFKSYRTGFKNLFINIRGYRAIKKNNLLDFGYYLKSYNDVRLLGIDPILHYMYNGFEEGRNPGITFDTKDYIKNHEDVKKSKLNPLIHYSLYGIREGRKVGNNPINDNTFKLGYNTNNIQKFSHSKDKKKVGKLHIGYVLWDFPTFSQTFVMNELRWLVKNNYDVTVFYKGKPDKEADLDFFVQSIQIKDTLHLIKKIDEFGINIIHTHFAYPTCTHLTYPASEKTGVPFTLSAHALDIFQYENDRRNKIGEIGKSKYCKKIFALGNYHYKYLVKRGVPEGKLMFMRQATKYKIENPININSPRFKRKIKNVITIARFVEKKGIDTLIDAAKILERHDLVFKIYGYGPLADTYQKQINDLNLKNITIEGLLEGDEVKKAYQDGDIFVLPCRRTSNGDMDGMPTVIFEAMAYGIPVITTNVSAIPEFVLNDYCGFVVNPDEPESIADKILYVKDMDKNELNTILKHAQVQVQKSTSVEENVETMLDIWKNNKIDLFMVTHQKGSYKNLESFKEILDRIFKHTTTEFDLTIVDNDSDEDFKSFILEYAKTHPNIQLIFIQDNLMCGPASNIALNAMKNEFAIYLCSNEAYIIKHGWERNALNYMKKHDDVGMAGYLAYSPTYYNGKTYRDQDFFEKFRNQEYINGKDNVKFKHVQGGVYILRREAFKQCGGFNPLLPQGYMDVEYSYYLQSNGWKLSEIPEWISLTKKTRPEVYAYLDENTTVVHPLKLTDLNNIEYITSNHCNICEGVIFHDICSVCNSDSSERAIYRIIGKTDKPYRSLNCTLLLKHNTLHKKFEEKMFTLVNTHYSKMDIKENIENVMENLETTYILITNLEFNTLNYEKILKMMIERLDKEGLLIIQLSNEELLNDHIKEFLTNQTFTFERVNFISKKLTKNEFIVVEKIYE